MPVTEDHTSAIDCLNEHWSECAIDTLNDLLKLMIDNSASDLFLTTGAPPSMKIDGVVHPLSLPKLAVGQVQQMAEGIMSPQQKQTFATTLECNFSWSNTNLGRYRVNVYHQRGEVAMVLRRINSHIPDFNTLGLPPGVADLVMQKRGLILVVGAAGSGKSTTLAAMIKYRSDHAPGHILTIEDPIEYLFPHSLSLVDQREVGIDTLTFADALHNALREAPDVIMIGEIRDRETAQHAIAYAETGHLCISTLHANNANQAIDRIINFFPEDARHQVLLDLSLNLKSVISQRLLPGIKKKRVLAIEILLQTAFISELILHGRLDEIKEAMTRNREVGLVTFDQSLFDLYKAGNITAEEAIHNADSVTDLTLKIRLDSKPSSTESGSWEMADGQ